MGYQRGQQAQSPDKTVETEQRSSSSSGAAHKDAVEESMQAVLGSRAASRQLRAELQQGNPSPPLQQMAQAVAPGGAREQRKPMFRGLSQEWGTAPSTGLVIQPKLTIGAPNDKYEQEADRVAEQVVQRLHSPAAGTSQPNQTLQRETLQRETLPDDEELQMKPLANQIQRVELPEEDELQMKPLLQRQGAFAASDDLESAIQQSRGGGQPLADSIREPMEEAFGGVDFSGVKVHTDAQSDQLNHLIQAKAFTTGQDIYLQQGAYAPGSRGGQELIAHELTHVVQQNGGAVQRSPMPLQLSNPGELSLQRMPVEDPKRKKPFFQDNKKPALKLKLTKEEENKKDFQIRNQLQPIYWKKETADTYYKNAERTEPFDVDAHLSTHRFGAWFETYQEALTEQAKIDEISSEAMSEEEKTRRKNAISMYLMQEFIVNALYRSEELTRMDYQASPLNLQEKSQYARSFATSYTKALQDVVGTGYTPNKLLLTRNDDFNLVLDKFFEVAQVKVDDPEASTIQSELATTIKKSAEFVFTKDRDLEHYWEDPEDNKNTQAFVDITPLLKGKTAEEQQKITDRLGRFVKKCFIKGVARQLAKLETEKQGKEAGGAFEKELSEKLEQDAEAKQDEATKKKIFNQQEQEQNRALADYILEDGERRESFKQWLREQKGLTPNQEKFVEALTKGDIESARASLIGFIRKAYSNWMKKIRPQAKDLDKELSEKRNKSLADYILEDKERRESFKRWLLSLEAKKVKQTYKEFVENLNAGKIEESRTKLITFVDAVYLNWVKSRKVKPEDLKAGGADAFTRLSGRVDKVSSSANMAVVTGGMVELKTPSDDKQSAVLLDDSTMDMAVKTAINKSGNVPPPSDSLRKLMKDKSLQEIVLDVLTEQKKKAGKSLEQEFTALHEKITAFKPETYQSLTQAANQLEKTKEAFEVFKKQFAEVKETEALEARAAIKLIEGSGALEEGVLPDFVLKQVQQHLEDAILNKTRIEDHVRSIQGLHEACILALELNSKEYDKNFRYSAPQLIDEKGKDSYFQGAHITDYGLKAFAQTYDAVVAQVKEDGRDSVDITAFYNIYFELTDKLRSTHATSKGSKVEFETPSSVSDFLRSNRFEGISPSLKRPDVVFVDIHPNDATKQQIVSNDILFLITGLFAKVKDPKTYRVTVMVDITLNHPGEDEVAAIRKHAQPYIRDGQLNLVFVQSMTKFTQLGMDKHSGGLVFAYNDPEKWKAFNESIAQARTKDQPDPTSHKYFQALFTYCAEEQKEYLVRVRENTKQVHLMLKEAFSKLNIKGDAIQIAENSDGGSCYVAMRYDEFIASIYPLEKASDFNEVHHFNEDVLEHGINELLRQTGLPVAMRFSFGFPVSNLGETGKEVRFTIGLEGKEQLQKYVDVISYINATLAKKYEELEKESSSSKFDPLTDRTKRQAFLKSAIAPIKTMEDLQSSLKDLLKPTL